MIFSYKSYIYFYILSKECFGVNSAMILIYFNTYVIPEGVEVSGNTHKTYKF